MKEGGFGTEGIGTGWEGARETPISPQALFVHTVCQTVRENVDSMQSTPILLKFSFWQSSTQALQSFSSFPFLSGTTEDFYDEGISDPYPMIIELAAKAIGNKIFYNAHFYFWDNLQIQRNHTYINQVRELVTRYISHYAYVHNKRHRPAWRIRKMIENGEFNETIEQCFEKEGQGCRKNLVTRFFCGPEKFCKNDPRRALDRAKENIL